MILSVFRLICFFIVLSSTASAGNNRPFWTEKSSYIEGKHLYAVGIASKVTTIEEGRKIAFQNGKQEISNFLQITDLGKLNIETQMTFEERNPDKSYTVFRLLKIESQKITKLKENKMKATKAVYKRYQEQQEKEIQTKEESLKKIQQNVQKLSELDELYKEIHNKVNSLSSSVRKYVKIGMNKNEVIRLLGKPRAVDSRWDAWNYGKYWIKFQSGIVKCISIGPIICSRY